MEPSSKAAFDLSGVEAITLDSRQVGPGSLFLALPGTRVNGAQFAREAAEKGAAAILLAADTDPELIPEGPRIFPSAQPLRDAARICAQFYTPAPTHVAGVTGTNGKTSVAWFARQLLNLNGTPAVSTGTLGLIPESLGSLPALTSPDAVSLHKALHHAKAKGFDHLVMEASSHGLDQHRLDGLSFDVAAFTNLSQDHLDYHGTMAAYKAAKLRLLTLKKREGTTITNADDAAFGDVPGWSYGWHGKEARIRRAEPTGHGLALKTDAFEVELPLIGAFQGHNMVCAWLIARALGIETADQITQVSAVPGRMEPVALRNGGGMAIVDYAHTPHALEIALKSLRPHTKGRLICVFGAGGNRDQAKRPLMGRAVADHADLALITDDNPRHEDPARIRAAIAAACPEAEIIGDRQQAIERALELAEPGDSVLIAGKGHESGQTLGASTRPFDDRLVTRALATASSTWRPQ